MTKFEIYGADAAEDITRLKLIYDENDGAIDLAVVDTNGDQEYVIAGINADGGFQLYEGIDEESGLRLDSNGRVVVTNYSWASSGIDLM